MRPREASGALLVAAVLATAQVAAQTSSAADSRWPHEYSNENGQIPIARRRLRGPPWPSPPRGPAATHVSAAFDRRDAAASSRFSPCAAAVCSNAAWAESGMMLCSLMSPILDPGRCDRFT
jgi:hypothetical protein